MSSTLRELLDENQFDLVLDALEKERNRALALGSRDFIGHGRVTEIEKREKWQDRAKELNRIINNLSSDWN